MNINLFTKEDLQGAIDLAENSIRLTQYSPEQLAKIKKVIDYLKSELEKLKSS